jgi:hypothetical protein
MIFTEQTSKKWYERQLSLMLTGLGYEVSHFPYTLIDLFATGLTLAKHGRYTALIYYRDQNRLVFKVAYACGTGKCMASGS